MKDFCSESYEVGPNEAWACIEHRTKSGFYHFHKLDGFPDVLASNISIERSEIEREEKIGERKIFTVLFVF